MSQNILFDIVIRAETQYYGQLSISKIRYEDGSAVSIKQFLGVEFKSPASVAATDFFYSINPWAQITAETTNQQIDASTYVVTAQLNIDGGYTFNSGDTLLTFGINGDLTTDPERYKESFTLGADQLPDTSGTISVHCAAAPDPALTGQQQALTFTEGERVNPITAPLGETTPHKIAAGTYAITAAELATPEQTVVAATQVSPSTVTVATGDTTAVHVTYGEVENYSAIDVVIGKISPLEHEEFHITVVEQSTGKTLADFWSPNNHTASLRRLPPLGTVHVSVNQISLNNVGFSFDAKSVDVSSSLYRVSFSQDDVNTTPVDTTGFVQLPIVVETNGEVDADTLVRLSSESTSYTQTVKAEAGTTPFAVPVAPGPYRVQTTSFIQQGIVYAVDSPATLTVAADGSTVLQVKVQRGANLNVRGFPNFLSFGGCADLTPGNRDDFVAARASSIFKYAGFDGAGDAGGYLTSDTATTRTIELARAVEEKLGDGNPVLPVMVSYTCNLSLGDPDRQLQNEEGLAHSFGNLILSLNLANGTIDEQHPVPAGYVINPDFLGDCQQTGRSPEYVMPVRKPLNDALDHWGVNAVIPSQITDTVRGYVLAVNWLVRTIAPAVTFGWQVNVWGVGASRWVYTLDDEPAEVARQTAAYVTSLGVFDGDYRPDFLAVDRYEADDFTVRGYINGYCYGPREWRRFFNFCGALSVCLQVPVMPWQIPSSRTPLVHDAVDNDFDPQHWGTGGSYILGDRGINSDYHNVNPKILAMPFPPAHPLMGKTAEDIFTRAEPFDLTSPAYRDFPLRGIFSVLLGGGATTGIVSSIGNPQPWVRNKLNAYMEDPIYFGDA